MNRNTLNIKYLDAFLISFEDSTAGFLVVVTSLQERLFKPSIETFIVLCFKRSAGALNAIHLPSLTLALVD